ncbi:M15 family metallopeptidase [Mesorhizobium sp. KR2-14]|uniref:M15 family metallopeptidase n=1 Tax=Mesorhizobium sp. KR2-14 TaxID=3156610 RepID=UPI0032B3E2E6
MIFTLSRGGENVIAEVQRWQYFLLRIGVTQVGGIDGDFGPKTETGTKIFQVQAGLTATGKVNEETLLKARELGYKILPDDYYHKRSTIEFPKKPIDLESPSNSSRNHTFTCFNFMQLPRASRPDAEAIVIRGSCDGSLPDWTTGKITQIDVPQLKFAKGHTGKVVCHKLAAPLIKRLFEAWEAADLLHLIMSYEGCFVPRYKRNQATPDAHGHSEKKSSDVSALSNHSFGSAFDINFIDNQLGHVPALCGHRGSTRELVELANHDGFFWGGHFSKKDGMHFEINRI